MAKFSELRTSLERDAIGASELKLHGRGQLLTRKHARDMHVGNRAQLLERRKQTNTATSPHCQEKSIPDPVSLFPHFLTATPFTVVSERSELAGRTCKTNGILMYACLK